MPQALILAPTRELALQVAEAIIAIRQHIKVRVLAVYGGQPYGPQISALKPRRGHRGRHARAPDGPD